MNDEIIPSGRLLVRVQKDIRTFTALGTILCETTTIIADGSNMIIGSPLTARCGGEDLLFVPIRELSGFENCYVRVDELGNLNAKIRK